MTTTAIAAVVFRKRNIVRGEVVSVASTRRPWVRTDVELRDPTGTLVLRFFGRSSIPGLVCGRQIVAQGTPSLVNDAIVMINPFYSFAEV